MKTSSLCTMITAAALMIVASCNNQDGAHSVPIDSTNDMGTAPVNYQGGSGDVTVDTTMQSAPYEKRSRQDSSNARSMNEAQGDQPAQPVESNTTDPKTTSGSDRK